MQHRTFCCFATLTELKEQHRTYVIASDEDTEQTERGWEHGENHGSERGWMVGRGRCYGDNFQRGAENMSPPRTQGGGRVL